MKFFLLVTTTFFLFLFTACTNSSESNIAQASDYEQYLSPDQNPNATAAKKELDFWSEKFEKTPTQYPYQAKMAGAHSALFATTGDINHLNEAYKLYQEVNKKTNNTQPAYLRALARNCISQHKFREAYSALKMAENRGDQLRSTQKMLFDVCLELGSKNEAEEYLNQIASKKDFDYNIRLAKWNDHEGDLDQTIVLMEQALADAVEKKNEGLILWSATNLGDYYGHAGRIEDSYQQYLRSLEIDPNNAYALKGIAWIAFSKDGNLTEAKRILKALSKRRDVPDYNLLLAEISEFENDDTSQKRYIDNFLQQVQDSQYGDMYNTYIAEVTESPEKILSIAKKEIENRPTPMSYALMAWAHYKNNDTKKALEIIEEKVNNKTFEPAAQYKMAVIYKENNLNDRTQALKVELGGSSYELGPVMKEKIASL
jgi:tetratricopeptide (TPR) repeat protein